MEAVDVLIVGSGPAGMSTALHLAQIDPAWAQRMVVVDKAIHPREKLCGGGITRLGVDVLNQLGLRFVPAHVAVQEIRLVYGSHRFAIRDKPILQVAQRDVFDHWLVDCGASRGVRVRQGEAVQAVTTHTGHVDVTTAHMIYRAKVVVAADGANSFVRQQLRWSSHGAKARLLEVLTPEMASERYEFRDGVAIFDFTPMADGLQGYYWDFPSMVNGQPMMNRGVYDSRLLPGRPRADLKGVLTKELARRGRTLDDYRLKGYPIHWFNAAGEFSRPRVLLVGDAAGADPMFGEGISFALAYGDAAAKEIHAAFDRQDFAFAAYRGRILNHPVLRQLHGRAVLARTLYRLARWPWLADRLWGLAPPLFGLAAAVKPAYVPVQDPRR